MTDYRAPVDDMRFVLEHIAGLPALAGLPELEHADTDTVGALVEESARFFEEVVAPLNRVGDTVGAKVEGDGVVMPEGFGDAYQRYIDAGWGSIPFEAEFGGGGFPWLVAVAVQEMLTSANMGFSLCPLLTQGAVDLLTEHASDEQKGTYLPKLISGEWSGTMNLTEPQAGSDVGAVSTKAVPADDGTYRISGQKIYITYGEHDMADNIVHLVLARTPDAPPGTKGISCFIVPKFLPDADGAPGERNGVSVVSIEHKIGIHASPTCVLAFEDATGFLIGDENAGMRFMFTMMNNARLSVGLQGLCLGERSYQQALDYAKERVQGRAVGTDRPRGEASPIVEHADVRRMLMLMKANVEAMRCVMYRNAAAIDRSKYGASPEDRTMGEAEAALLTPISKGWGTDLGVELTSLAIQVYGGMGYVEETGVAQHWRDARIAPIYEGTNGIQAADLVGRKLPMDGGGVVKHELAAMRELADALTADAELADLGPALATAIDRLDEASQWMLGRLQESPVDAMAGSSPYLRLFGVVEGASELARSALVAKRLLADGDHGFDDQFLADKAATARFYIEQVVPESAGLAEMATSGASATFALPVDRL
ncbi:MAG: acyl-CoA dehydrogenase [Actinomycetota bacterium]